MKKPNNIYICRYESLLLLGLLFERRLLNFFYDFLALTLLATTIPCIFKSILEVMYVANFTFILNWAQSQVFKLR